jgi:hypothetical protein
MIDPSTFSAVALALYAGHHVGDYWVQRDIDARHKGDAGPAGRLHCLHHVITYTATQTLFLAILGWTVDVHAHWWAALLGLAVSGVTHYAADRREHGAMFWLARAMPWKVPFLKLGAPRNLSTVGTSPDNRGREVQLDNPSLGTGAWALDQAWHIFWGVFVAGLLVSM